MHANTHPSPKKREISNSSVSKSNILDSDALAYDPTKAERALWAAVITQALMDAGSESRKPEARHEKAKAIRWLLGNSEDFVTVCQNADLDPQYVREKAKMAIERGCVWRRGMAEKRTPAQTAMPERKQYIPVVPLGQPSRPRRVALPLCHPPLRPFAPPLPLSFPVAVYREQHKNH